MNACSNWKKLLGNLWNKINKSFNIPITGCSILVVIYTIINKLYTITIDITQHNNVNKTCGNRYKLIENYTK